MTGICQSCGKKKERLRTCSFCGASICSECDLQNGCKLCGGRFEA